MNRVWADVMDPSRTARAVAMAAEMHAGQLRKGTRVAYLSHLWAVAALVAEDDGSESEVLAALLHDAAEDAGGEQALSRIERELGHHVAGLVRECSDSISGIGEPKAPWEERKQAALDRLSSTSTSALKVIAADKLHNTRATLADLHLHGDGVWQRFKTGEAGFRWYHEAMAERLLALLPGSRSVRLLSAEVERWGA